MKESDIAVALKTLGGVSLERFGAIVKLLCQAPGSQGKWKPKTFESVDTRFGAEIVFPQMVCQNTVRTRMKKALNEHGVEVLESDGSSIVLSSTDANIVEGMRNKGKKGCLEEVTDVELQWDEHGIMGGKKQCNMLVTVRFSLIS